MSMESVAANVNLREFAGCFPTGVAVVTTNDDAGTPHGSTISALTSLSLDPMLVLVCVDKTADTHDILSKAGVFAVNILNKEQAEISDRFAKKEFDGAHGLDDLPHGFAVTGAPIIDGALAYLDCRTITEHHGGDHTIFIGQVAEARELSNGEPLVFYGGRYGHFKAD